MILKVITRAIIIHQISSYLLFFIAVAAFIFVANKVCHIGNEYSYHEKSKRIIVCLVAAVVALCTNGVAIGKPFRQVEGGYSGE